jgi:hypothetical protein
MTNTLPAEVQALVLAALVKRVEGEQDKVKAVFSGSYMAGSKQTFRSPLDEAPLGYIQRTDPAPAWRVTDEAALREHLAEFPGCTETVLQLAVAGFGLVELDPVDELAVVLREHAAHLLIEETRVSDEAIDAAVEQSKATGIAAAPGITRVRPGGQLRVVPDKDAAAAVGRMVDAGLITWDGRPVLEAAKEAS